MLRHAGILAGAPEDPSESVVMDMPDDDCFHIAWRDGLLQPLADLGETVARGQPIARIWPADRTGLAPEELRAARPADRGAPFPGAGADRRLRGGDRRARPTGAPSGFPGPFSRGGLIPSG